MRAVDNSNGEKDLTPAFYTWEIDATPPDTMITDVKFDDCDPKIEDRRKITYTFGSNEMNVTYECSINDGMWVTCTSPFLLDGTNLPDAEYVFKVRARDRANPRRTSVHTATAPPARPRRGPREIRRSW